MNGDVVKRHLAHALRRTARKLIAWSNRLDEPQLINTEKYELPPTAEAWKRWWAANSADFRLHR